MTALTTPLHAPAPLRERTGIRPSTMRLILDQVRYAVRDLWRTRLRR